jgi:CDP-glucose 4,6-dehydratase
VCVTGHTGFKGSWLCLWLHRLGASVSGYALAPERPSLFAAADLAQLLSDSRGDVTDASALASHLGSNKPEVVFHLAAQSLVRRSYEMPLETYAVNAYGTAAILEAIRKTSSVRAAIIVTSDKCYDLNQRRERYSEDDALGGDDPYSASKAAAEYVVAAYRTSFWQQRPEAPRVASVRSGNVIGGGDWAQDRLLPDLIAAFSAGKPALVRNPDAVRPWQHVLDPLRGYLLLAERLYGDSGQSLARAWNFGPSQENELPVSAIATEAASYFGTGASWRIDQRQHPPEAAALRLDSTLAAAKLGWTAKVPLPSAVRRTLEWHKAFAGGASARTLCEREIDDLAMSAATV